MKKPAVLIKDETSPEKDKSGDHDESAWFCRDLSASRHAPKKLRTARATIVPRAILVLGTTAVRGWIVDIQRFDTVTPDRPVHFSSLIHRKPQPAENSVKK